MADARLSKFRGMRRTWKHTAVTCPVESATSSREARIQKGEGEGNEAGGCFPTAP